MKLDHVVRPGREHSNGVRWREEDRLAVPGGSIEPLEGQRLLATLRRICREADCGYEVPFTPDEDRAALNCASVFLRECGQAATDPLQLLQTLARNWSRLRAGVLRDDAGRQIYLPGEVSFLHFYRFRSEILKWLNENTRGIKNG